MSLARDAVVRCLGSVIAFCGLPVLSDLPAAASAMAQEAADSMNLSGVWQFDYEVVDLTHGGSGVRAEFLDGAECFDGQVRPYFLNGVLSGTSLTGTMMVCSRSPDLVEACGISSMYETTFEATVETGRIAGTRVAQGLAIEEEGGRTTSCRPDSQYDGTYPFEGTLCDNPILEALRAGREAIRAQAQDLADRITATPGVGQDWQDDDYAGPAADLAGRFRLLVGAGNQMLAAMNEVEEEPPECEDDACPSPGEMDALRAGREALHAQAQDLADTITGTPGVGQDWQDDAYAGPAADVAAQFRQVVRAGNTIQGAINEAEERMPECGGADECPSREELDVLRAGREAISAHLMSLAGTITGTPGVGQNWQDDDYAGPAADLAAQFRELARAANGMQAAINQAEERLPECEGGDTCPSREGLDALRAGREAVSAYLQNLGARILATPDVGQDWQDDAYAGPAADLAEQFRNLARAANEMQAAINQAEERLQECEAQVG